VSKHIGISKDFNIFELQKAIGMRDDRKALLIANYFANNTKEHHIIPVMGGLYSYFRKLIKYHGVQNKANDREVASSLGVPPYFVKEYHQAGANYRQRNILEAIDILHDIDLKSKGVNNTDNDPGSLMREMVARLLRA
jgi:DNA polymerase-3 subunit delta